VVLTKHYFWDDVYYLLQRFSWREAWDRINYVSSHGIHQTQILGKTFKDTMATTISVLVTSFFYWMGGGKGTR
jgi:hypothetical protein